MLNNNLESEWFSLGPTIGYEEFFMTKLLGFTKTWDSVTAVLPSNLLPFPISIDFSTQSVQEEAGFSDDLSLMQSQTHMAYDVCIMHYRHFKARKEDAVIQHISRPDISPEHV